MPRHTTQTFNCDPLDDLTRQLLYAPAERRESQVRRAEALHDILEPEQNYPLDFFVYRITGYHAESDGDTLLVGAAAAPDLRLMIDKLSRSLRMVVTDGETIETPDALADRLNVTTKTLTRWRKLGLRWRWMMLAGGRRLRVVYPRDGVDAFLERHGQRVEQAGAFTQLEPDLKQSLLERARRIAEVRDVSLNQVASHLSKRTGRALETIRQLLDKHDRENADDPIFKDRTGPLKWKQKRLIARAVRVGIPVSKLCRRFKRTRSTVHRAVRDHKAATYRRLRIAYHTSPTFERDDADEVILRPNSDPDFEPALPAPDTPDDAATLDEAPKRPSEAGEVVGASRQRHSSRYVEDLPHALRPLFQRPMLDEARQLAMFVRLNYLKYKIDQRRDTLDTYEPRARDLDAIADLLRQVKRVRQRLVEANLSTVLSVARQQLMGVDDPKGRKLIALLESGERVLIDAVDRFNPFQDQTFLRFVVWTLSRHFAALSTGEEAAPQATPRARSRKREADEGSSVLRRMQQAAEARGVELAEPDGD